MGRKNLIDIRSAEILAAFERSVAKYGIEVPLEQVADEAGVRRSIIRHYIGNREALVNNLIERITQDYPAQVEEAMSHSDSVQDMQPILDYLFRVEVDYTTSDKIIVDVMLTAKERYPKAKSSLMNMYTLFVEQLSQALARIYPQAPVRRCWQVAYAIICLSESNQSLLWLGIDQSHNIAARASAELLLRSLEST